MQEKLNETFETKKRKLWQIKEHSTYYGRNCLSSDCREVTFNMYNLKFDEERRIAVKMVSQYSCTFCCLNRPRLMVYFVENNSERLLGSIEYPYDFCNFVFKAVDASGQTRFMTKFSCWACAICFRGCGC